MITRRAKGRQGFRRRAPAQGAPFRANIKITNTSGTEYTGPVDFGLAVNPGSFNPAIERLVGYTSAQETGHDTCRWVRATKFVTVPANSDQIISIDKETGAQTTPASLTIAQILALVTDWDRVFRFTDTLNTDYTVSLRALLSGSTTFGVNADYVSAQPWRNTATVKEWVVAGPFRDNTDAEHVRLALKGTVAFYSDDNFTTIDSIRCDISLTNDRLFASGGDRLPVVGELVVQDGIASPVTVASHLKRGIGSGSYSTSSHTFSSFSTASFTLDDSGKLLIADGGFEMVVYELVNSTSMKGFPGTQNYLSQSLTNAVLWPVHVDPSGMVYVPIPDWPNANPLIARQKTQEMRDHWLIMNNARIRPIQAQWAHGSGLHSANLYNARPCVGQYNRDSQGSANTEIRDEHGFPILSNVDEDGFISPETYRFLVKSDEVAHGVFLSAFFINDSDGLFNSAGTWRWHPTTSAIYVDAKFYGYKGSANSHNSLMNFQTWALTGRWSQVRALYMQAKAQRINSYENGDTKNILLTGFNNNLGFPSGSARAMGNYLWINALYGKSMPPTTPSGCLLPATNADAISYLNATNCEATVPYFGIDVEQIEGSPLPQWSAGLPFVGDVASISSWELGNWADSYFSAGLIEALEGGLLSAESIKIVSVILLSRLGGLINDHYTSTDAQKRKFYYTIDGLTPGGTFAPIPYATAQTPAAFWQYIINEFDKSGQGGSNYEVSKLMILLWVKYNSDKLVHVNATQLQAAINWCLAESSAAIDIPLKDGGTDIDYDNWTVPTQTKYVMNYRPRS